MKKLRHLRLINLCLFSVLIFMLLARCAAPYKLMPEFEESKDKIGKIAVYPVYYSTQNINYDKGANKEFHLFGELFNVNFFKALEDMPMVRPIEFISPENTIALLKDKGVSAIKSLETIEIEDGESVEFTNYIYPLTGDDIKKALSENADALLIFNLIDYNEVSHKEVFKQAFCTALTLGLLDFSRYALLKMDISLIRLDIEKQVWIWEKDMKSTPAGGWTKEASRKNVIEYTVEGFKDYFPFSKEFDNK